MYFLAVNQCSPNPCKNGGLCVEKGTKYECTCPFGYKGVTCEGEKFSCHLLTKLLFKNTKRRIFF